MRSGRVAATAALVLASIVQVPVTGAAGPPQTSSSMVLDDPEGDCFEAVPESLGVAGVSDAGQVVKLEVMVLLDEVPLPRARSIMERVARSYEPLGIEVVVTRFRRISVPADPPRPGGTRPAARVEVLFKTMKDAVGGSRPRGTDLVHLLTGKDVYSLNQGEPSYSLAGVADCIGGVRYDKHAFSFSEGIGEWDEIREDMAGVITVHEIGHLMGAHHHYGNCVEGSPIQQGEHETPCTVMFPAIIALNAGNFGALDGSVVRGHAVDFASP